MLSPAGFDVGRRNMIKAIAELYKEEMKRQVSAAVFRSLEMVKHGRALRYTLSRQGGAAKVLIPPGMT